MYHYLKRRPSDVISLINKSIGKNSLYYSFYSSKSIEKEQNNSISTTTNINTIKKYNVNGDSYNLIKDDLPIDKTFSGNKKIIDTSDSPYLVQYNKIQEYLSKQQFGVYHDINEEHLSVGFNSLSFGSTRPILIKSNKDTYGKLNGNQLKWFKKFIALNRIGNNITSCTLRHINPIAKVEKEDEKNSPSSSSYSPQYFLSYPEYPNTTKK